MIIFYSDNVSPNSLCLSAEDSLHCAKVLRHRAGDSICVIDGAGTMYECRITDANPKCVCAAIENSNPLWHSHPYRLTMAVCPTKNNERFEWFIEKATEVGVDRIVPLIGEHSERKVYKTERARKIAISAAKQSLKALVPEIAEPVAVKDFIAQTKEGKGGKFIAYCFDDPAAPRISLKSQLAAICAEAGENTIPEITILIGPEGDFSPAEAGLALEGGYTPIHLGDSRLRTETAAIVAATMVYTIL